MRYDPLPLTARRVALAVAAALCVVIALAALSPRVSAASAASSPAQTTGDTAAHVLAILEETVMINYGGPQVGLTVVDAVKVINTGEADQPRVLLPLAPAHRKLEFRAGTTAEQVEAGEESFVDKQVLKAGETRRYVFTYIVPVRLPATLRRPVLYPTESFILAVPENQMAAEAPGLARGGLQPAGGQQYRLYTGAGLAADPAFALRLRVNTTGIEGWFWALALIVAFPGAALIAIQVRARRLKKKAPKK